MTQSDPIYGLIALSFVFGMGLTVLIGAIWLYATEWLMEKFNVSDPLDRIYFKKQINQAHLNGELGLIYVDKRKLVTMKRSTKLPKSRKHGHRFTSEIKTDK